MVLKSRIGRRFGRLTVIARAANRGSKTHWLCWCDCGNKATVESSALVSGNTSSCGCIWRERMTIHGRSRTREYRAWRMAKRRCYNKSTIGFENYGGRGIRMCSEWITNFQAFFDYTGPCPEGMTLDRKDTDGHYEPGNVRWATQKEQANNRRTNRRVEFYGESFTIAQLATAMNIHWKTAKRRFANHG
jgi:hypothetical protein